MSAVDVLGRPLPRLDINWTIGASQEKVANRIAIFRRVSMVDPGIWKRMGRSALFW